MDAAFQVPTNSYESVSKEKNVVALLGERGGFDEISVNGGRPKDQRVDGIGNGNPVLSNIDVRRAIAHAIDTSPPAISARSMKSFDANGVMNASTLTSIPKHPDQT